MQQTLTPKQQNESPPVRRNERKNDVTRRLEQELAREPGQHVQAFNVGRSHYRVNWLVYDGPSQKIAKSQFLFASVGQDGALTVEDKTLRDSKFRHDDLLAKLL